MDLFEALEKRRSYRGPFQDRPVPREALRRILQAGLAAPSGRNMQTTSFVAVDDPDLVERIRAIPGGNQAVREARAYIACIMDEEAQAVYEGHSFQVEDCAAAVENMFLAATALGYGTVWIDGWLRLQGRAALLGALLGLPAGKLVRVLLPLGVPAASVPAPPKRPFSERAWFNRYGAPE